MTEFTLMNELGMVVEDCISCGVQFAMPKTLNDNLRKTGKGFYCPNGHSMYYKTGESEADKLRRRLQRQEQENARLRDEREAAERRAAAAKGQVTKIKNRVGKGICPCCNRSFQNLQRHMASKHPEMLKPEAAE